MNIIKGAGHIWEGGDGTERRMRGHRQYVTPEMRRVTTRCWHAIADPCGGKATDDQLDYLTYGLMLSKEELVCDLRFGNMPDGLYIANDHTGAVYRVTGGKLAQTNWKVPRKGDE